MESMLSSPLCSLKISSLSPEVSGIATAKRAIAAAKKCLLIDFPNTKLAALLVSQWLDIWDLGRFDSAVCNHSNQLRVKYLRFFGPTSMFAMTSTGHSVQSHLHPHSPAILSHKIITSPDCIRFLQKRNIALTTLSLAVFTDKRLLDEYLLQYGHKLTSLDFGGHYGNADSWQLYYDVFNLCPRLQAVVFHTHSSLICPQDVLDITQKCPLLRKLHFQNKFHLLPPKNLVKKYPKTQPNVSIIGGEEMVQFALRGYAKSTLFCLTNLTEQCENLTILDLEGCTGLNDAALLKLATGRCNIRTLNVNHCTKLTATGVLAYVIENTAKNVHLEQLHLMKVEVVDDILVTLSEQCINLTLLDMRLCKPVTDTGLSAVVRQCCKLDTLLLQSNEHITDTTVETLAQNCTALHTLTLHNCIQLTNASVQYIAQCANLRTLDIGGRSAITDITLPPSVTDLNVSFLPSLTDTHIIAMTQAAPLLVKLNISGLNSVSDHSMAAIAIHCTCLRELCMNELIYITDRGVSALVQALGGTLQVLSVADCVRITDEAVVTMAQCCGKGLRSLRLRGLDALTDIAGKSNTVYAMLFLLYGLIYGALWLGSVLCAAVDHPE